MKLSVCMITYNHEKYISKAIDGFLMQKTNFLYEIVIGEDCSSDNTRSICEEYAYKYPDLIKLLPSHKNLGMAKNFVRTLKACNGKYIALCEGDDYWTDPYKLQKQVDFLEANPEYMIVSHAHNNINEKGTLISERKFEDAGIIELNAENLAQGFYIQTLTAVFRKIVFNDAFWTLIKNVVMVDFALFLNLADRGKIAILPDVMANRRLHPLGIYSGKSKLDQYNGFKKTTQMVDQYFKGKYKRHLYIGRLNSIFSIFTWYIQHKKSAKYVLLTLMKLLYGYLLTRYFYRIKPKKFYSLKDVCYWMKIFILK